MIRLFLLSLVAACLSLSAADPASTIFLVRHAERGAAMTDDVPITEAGRERASALARLLADADVAGIVISDTVRTRQTAEPLATKLRLTPVAAPRNNLGALADAIRKSAIPGRSLLVVRHSNEVPALVEALGGPRQPAMNDDEYSRLYVVTLADGKLISVRTLRYGR